jgi:hypothetical protein
MVLEAYPDFKRQRIATPDIERALDDAEQRIVDDFIDYCSITAGNKKCRDIRAILVQIRYVMEKPFNDWGLDDIRRFLSLLNHSGKRDWTTQGIKIVLKRFIKWYFKDWSERFNNLDDVRLKKVSRV